MDNTITDLKLEEFRSSVKDFLPDDCLNDDSFLMRWLIARENNVEKAANLLKNYIEWKDANDIDKILEWTPPDELKDACPFQILRSDHEGRPILLFPWGKWKPWVFTSEKYVHLYQKYMDYMIHTVLSHTTSPNMQFVVIADSNGFTYSHMKYIKALEINLEAVRQFEAHYPELLHSAIAINCPKAFTVLYSLLKPLMTKRTRGKISIFGNETEKWKSFLADRMSQEVLPNAYKM